MTKRVTHKHTKTCKICKQEKSLEEFHKCGKANASYCKPCQALFYKEWRAKNIESIRIKDAKRYKPMPSDKRADSHLKRRYGISYVDYISMFEEQKGVCKICGQESVRKRLSVDHCHTTGKVRGLLCERCNTLLGRVKDNPIILDNAAFYLRTTK